MLGTATKLKNTRNIALTGAVSGNANFDGSGDVTINTTQANIATLTGTINLTAASSVENPSFNTLKINFPSGFNSSNCVPIAWGIYQGTGSKYSFGCTTSTDSRTWLRNGLPSMLTFDFQGDGKITFTVEFPQTEAKTYNYKIVLMKTT